jgi:CHASE3 domain sensor protein
MNLQKFQALLARAILLPLVLALLLGGVLFWAVRSLNNAAARVDHSDEVISQSNYLLKLFIDMETGLRAYVITGLCHYRRREVPAAIQRSQACYPAAV